MKSILVVSDRARIVEAGDSGLPVVLKYPESASAKAFEGIIDRIVKTVDH